MSDPIDRSLPHSRGRWVVPALLMMTGLAAWPARSQTEAAGPTAKPWVRTAQILDLAKDLALTGGAPDAYALVENAAFDAGPGGAVKMKTYEENALFIEAVAEIETHGVISAGGKSAGFSWTRRLIILNPSTFIVDDEFPTTSTPVTSGSCIASPVAPQATDRKAHIVLAQGEISAELLFPDNADYQIRQGGQGTPPDTFCLEARTRDHSPVQRILQVLRVVDGGQTAATAKSDLDKTTGQLLVAATVGNRVFKMTLPPPAEGAGQITITTSNGRTVLATRPLPSGILPHGPEGNRLLEYWDSAYRHKAPAPWDIGRPADELQKVVSGGKVSRCRAVDLCCGSGTDAIYLAGQGFDVTGIDVSPTALGQARQKANDAKVSVHWVLADTLAPPDLKAFDFIYDRACYHVVRQQKPGAYVETVKGLSHPGSTFLLLSARKDDPLAEGGWGVTEEELRFDFLNLFDIESLREVTLETSKPGFAPPAWSAVLKRKAAN